MSGHSKWSQIKHKKSYTDAKRGKIFTKIAKEISIAVRIGGGNQEGNPRLRTAIDKAKEVNMPSENIKRAIMKGTGELPGVVYEESIYEGYGPYGIALFIEIFSDNKNRTISEIRHILSKHRGNLGEVGCVSWMFEKKGYILVNKSKIDEDILMALILEAGALDMKNEQDENDYEIITSPENLKSVKEALEKQNIPISLSEITMLPKTYIQLEKQESEKMIQLINTLEDHEDVQNVYANFDIID